MSHDGQQKVTARHLARSAYLYVRQSTVRQVLENTESTERQYALRQRAIALGWPSDQVIVIDSDLGLSGASAADRAGFQRLVAEVGLGRAGIVLGLEVSRLARNSTDWHRLLEICALTDTLILDEDGVYDPTHFNDRLLLGLKGTMSEAELHVLSARLRGGIINKARRGELKRQLPVGFVYDGQERVTMEPDVQVQESVHLFFQTFQRTGSARATIKYFRTQHLLFPTRLAAGPRQGEIVWGPLSLGRAANALHNPCYAGVYAFGRSRWRTHPDGRRRREFRPPSEWVALIRDAHPAYIPWEQYLENQRRLEMSARALRGSRQEASPREGSALLQGRAICGLCGMRMQVQYTARRGELIPRYVCGGRGRDFGDPLCQTIVGTAIDRAIAALLIEKVTPVALEMTLAIAEEIECRIDEADRLRHRQVERAQYEADLARQRYLRVDPANRLVADALEANWNAKLRALSDASDDYERQRIADRQRIDAGEQRSILALASDLPVVWSHPNTSDRDRKRMLALMIEDVTLTKQHQITVAIRLRSGTTDTVMLPRPLTAQQARATHPEVRQQIDALLAEYTDAQVAHRLNEQGLRSGAGQPFDADSVRWIRHASKMSSLKDRLLAAGMLTCRQLSEKLGIGRTTIGRWRQRGLIQARICNGAGEWLYWPPTETPPSHPGNTAMDRSAARVAV